MKAPRCEVFSAAGSSLPLRLRHVSRLMRLTSALWKSSGSAFITARDRTGPDPPDWTVRSVWAQLWVAAFRTEQNFAAVRKHRKERLNERMCDNERSRRGSSLRFLWLDILETHERLQLLRPTRFGLVANRTEPSCWRQTLRRRHGDPRDGTEAVHQQGEVHRGGRCPQPDRQRGEWALTGPPTAHSTTCSRSKPASYQRRFWHGCGAQGPSWCLQQKVMWLVSSDAN